MLLWYYSLYQNEKMETRISDVFFFFFLYECTTLVKLLRLLFKTSAPSCGYIQQLKSIGLCLAGQHVCYLFLKATFKCPVFLYIVVNLFSVSDCFLWDLNSTKMTQPVCCLSHHSSALSLGIVCSLVVQSMNQHCQHVRT